MTEATELAEVVLDATVEVVLPRVAEVGLIAMTML